MTHSKARVAQVQIGNLEIEGLRWIDEEGNVAYGVAVSQLAANSLVNQNHATRDLKRMMGEGFPLTHQTSELNSKPVNVVKVSDFSKVIVAAAFKGNSAAQQMTYVLTGTSVETLFADAFGDTQTPQDRQDILKVLAQQWASPSLPRYRREQKALGGKGYFFTQDIRLQAVVVFAGEKYLGMKRVKESYPQLLLRLGMYTESGILQTVINHLANFDVPYGEDFWPEFFQAYPDLAQFRKDIN